MLMEMFFLFFLAPPSTTENPAGESDISIKIDMMVFHNIIMLLFIGYWRSNIHKEDHYMCILGRKKQRSCEMKQKWTTSKMRYNDSFIKWMAPYCSKSIVVCLFLFWFCINCDEIIDFLSVFETRISNKLFNSLSTFFLVALNFLLDFVLFIIELF